MEFYSVVLIVLVLCHILPRSYGTFLDQVSGEIYGGNFSYFTLSHPGILSLDLISHTGDCDLYVSQYEKKPTFEHYSYCLQSSSCGVDTIIVPKSFKRPLAIGIYGHPYHRNSSYTLNIFQIDELTEDDDLYIATKYGTNYYDRKGSAGKWLANTRQAIAINWLWYDWFSSHKLHRLLKTCKNSKYPSYVKTFHNHCVREKILKYKASFTFVYQLINYIFHEKNIVYPIYE